MDFFKLVADQDVFGLVVVAHGDKSRKGTFSGSDEYIITPRNTKEHLHHKLGALKLVVCYAGVKGKEWRQLVSRYGFFWADEGAIHAWRTYPGWMGGVKRGFDFK